MIGYIRYFKSSLIAGLQYKISALSGLSTQLFWGLLYVFIYKSFIAMLLLIQLTIRNLCVMYG